MKKQLILLCALTNALIFGCAEDSPGSPIRPTSGSNHPNRLLEITENVHPRAFKHTLGGRELLLASQRAQNRPLLENLQREIQWRDLLEQTPTDSLAGKAFLTLAQNPLAVRDKLELLHRGAIDPKYRFLVPALAVSTALKGRIGQSKELAGHTMQVDSAAFSPDGSRIVSASPDRTVRVWDAATGQCLHTMQGHTNWISSAAFSSDGSRIVSASYDRTLRVWDAATGQCLHTLQGHTGSLLSAAFSPDGSRIVSASYDRTLRVWDAATGQCLHTLQDHADNVYSAAFSPDGPRIVSASNDHTVRVWDAATGQCLHTMQGHTGWVRSATFSSDGSRIVSVSADRTVRVWDTTTGQCQHTLQGHTGWIRSATFSPDGSHIVSASGDRTVRVWDTVTGQCLHTMQGHTDSVHSAAFSPDGSRIISASADRTVRVWDTTTGQCLHTMQGHTDWIGFAAFSPDGSRIISASYDRTVRVWQDFTTLLCSVAYPHEQGFLLSAAHDWKQGQAHNVTPEQTERYRSLITRFTFLNDPRLFVLSEQTTEIAQPNAQAARAPERSFNTVRYAVAAIGITATVIAISRYAWKNIVDRNID